MSKRRIATTGTTASAEIADVLQSALASELIGPPSEVWVVSPWITDAVVIDNRGGEFSTVAPTWPESDITLSEALVELAGRGARVTIVMRDDVINQEFRRRVEKHMRVVTRPDVLHRKRLVTERFVIWGSMNFTRAGIQRNEEDVEIETNPADVAQAIGEMVQLYGENVGQ